MGRHSHPDEFESPEPDPADTAAVLAAIRQSAPPAGGSTARAPKTSAVADLQLVLHSPRLLSSCLAVAVAPFICYFTVITLLHEMHVWAIFLGAPLVLAGVLVGAVLDRAYARQAKGVPPAQSAQLAQPVTIPASAALAEPDLRSVEGARLS